jgi:hypothetical protein
MLKNRVNKSRVTVLLHCSLKPGTRARPCIEICESCMHGGSGPDPTYVSISVH